jgi:hypothetical protein
MFYPETRLTRDVKQPTVRKYAYNLTTGIPLLAKTLICQNSRQERSQVSFYKTSQYRPGQFKNTAFQRQHFSAQCADTSMVLKLIHLNKVKPYRRYDGPLAMLFNSRCVQNTTTEPVVHDAYLESVALAQAYARVVEPDIDQTVFFGELADTVQLLMSPLKFFVKQYKRLHKQNVRSSRKFSGKSLVSSLTDNWMQYRYGIMPALSDADGLMKLFDVRAARPVAWKLRKRNRYLSSPATTSVSKIYKELREEAYWMYRVTETNSTDVHAKVFYRINDLAEYEMGMQGRSRYQLARQAWDLVPFSFVEDWVFDVGTWITNRCPIPGCQVLGNSISIKRTRNVELYVDIASLNSNMTFATRVDSMMKFVDFKYERCPGGAPATEPLLSPAIMNLKRSFDSVSLIWQQMPYKKR